MAFQIIGIRGGSFAIDQSVGRSMAGEFGVNRRDDVMLVQWILNRILTSKDYLGPRLAVDGQFGPATDYLICRWLVRQRDHHLMSYKEEFDTLLPGPVWTGNNSIVASMATILLQPGIAEFQSTEVPGLLKTMPPLLQTALTKNLWNFDKQGPKSMPFPQ